eukprot:CAMPEP_0167757974 /NCGR_PEP_ID=MMETSP0110_2-20121227/10217_1 /TAXON_ID=629695 /ORGANISM="Gymnochlora sp., Strain CCMP2014" /LENGTH=188 /DNA_ID=CAMNT_0007644211 /DNA_START=153 /DNA_END=719 /DNA_ORIENTATION=-
MAPQMAPKMAPLMRSAVSRSVLSRPFALSAPRMQPMLRCQAETPSGPSGPTSMDMDVEAELDESLDPEADAKQKEIERLRAAEKFFKKGTGDYECTQCQFVYKPEIGDPEGGVLKMTEFADIPDDWLCPVCGAAKDEFEEQGKIVAGFAENQGYGFGTNSMTEGQKSALIYGSLVAFFGLFLLGYKMN